MTAATRMSSALESLEKYFGLIVALGVLCVGRASGDR